jgi:hypothetical protein
MDTKNSSIFNPKLKDITGNKYSRLKVISRASNTKTGLAQWNCLCDCGNKTISTGANLRSGLSKSCGCYQKEKCKEGGIKRRKNLIGNKFYMLTILKKDEADTKKVLCICDCGKEKTINLSDLIRGNHKSCGCSKNLMISNALKKSKEYHIKKRAERYQKRRACPLRNLTMRVRSCIASAFRYEGFKKNSKSSLILGCTYKELKTHIEKQFYDDMSWERFDEIHIDHIIPLSSAKSEQDIINLNHHTNLRPMWAKDNIFKSNKIEFLI